MVGSFGRVAMERPRTASAASMALFEGAKTVPTKAGSLSSAPLNGRNPATPCSTLHMKQSPHAVLSALLYGLDHAYQNGMHPFI